MNSAALLKRVIGEKRPLGEGTLSNCARSNVRGASLSNSILSLRGWEPYTDRTHERDSLHPNDFSSASQRSGSVPGPKDWADEHTLSRSFAAEAPATATSSRSAFHGGAAGSQDCVSAVDAT